MEQSWKVAIHRQREELARMLHEPLTKLAQQCAPVWCERDKLNEVLLLTVLLIRVRAPTL